MLRDENGACLSAAAVAADLRWAGAWMDAEVRSGLIEVRGAPAPAPRDRIGLRGLNTLLGSANDEEDEEDDDNEDEENNDEDDEEEDDDEDEDDEEDDEEDEEDEE